jgi:GT2 family glycosyltransferase
MARVSLTTVIVAHDSLAELRRTLPALVAELRQDDELIVVDNASGDGLQDELPRIAPDARLVRLSENVGFAAGANAGAWAARGELLVLLNPDVTVAAGWGEGIRRPWGSKWAAWMALVLLNGGEQINTSGGVLHFTGFGWAGQLGQPRELAPRQPTEVGFLSGACLAIPRRRFHELGGFPEQFFMYCEDVDLSLRLRLFGGKLAVVPDVTVSHGYEFAKGQLKWRLLERNRWATLVRTYPGPLLAAVIPALIATEVVVWVAAARGGWGRMKLLATFDVLRALPRLLAERRAIQPTACLGPAEFAAQLTPGLDSPYFGTLGGQLLLRRALILYWNMVRRFLALVCRPNADDHLS